MAFFVSNFMVLFIEMNASWKLAVNEQDEHGLLKLSCNDQSLELLPGCQLHELTQFLKCNF